MTNTETVGWQPPEIPPSAPALLRELVAEMQQALSEGNPSQAGVYLRDALAFLITYFAGAATGSLRSVGPFSSSITFLLEDAPSLVQSEQLLRQAFQDWQSRPHNLAYESLREVFFITSRLQSSRLAARRHTRWLQVSGAPINGLEDLTRWGQKLHSQREDKVFCEQQLARYLPVLSVWLRAAEPYFKSWNHRYEAVNTPGASNGKVRVRVFLHKEDCRFELTPNLDAGPLESHVVLSPDGQPALGKGLAPTAATAASTTSSPPAAPAPAAKKDDFGLEWDPVTKAYKVVGRASANQGEAPVAPSAAPSPPPPGPPAAPAKASGGSELGIEWDPASNSYKVVRKSTAAPPPTPAPRPPDQPALIVPVALPAVAVEPAATLPEFELIVPVAPEPEPVVPEPEPVASEPVVPEVELTEPAVPEPEPAVPEFELTEPVESVASEPEPEPEPVVPEFELTELVEPVAPEPEPEPGVPEFELTEPVESVASEPEPEPEPEVPEFELMEPVASEPEPEPEPEVPEFELTEPVESVASEPEPEPEPEMPEFELLEPVAPEPEPEVPELELMEPVESVASEPEPEPEPVVPEFELVEPVASEPEPEPEVPEFEQTEPVVPEPEPVVPEFEQTEPVASEPEPEPEVPEFELMEPVASEPEPELVVPEIELTEPVVPGPEPEAVVPEFELTEPVVPEPEPVVPEVELTEPAVPEPEPAVPEFELTEPVESVASEPEPEPEPVVPEFEPAELVASEPEPEATRFEPKRPEVLEFDLDEPIASPPEQAEPVPPAPEPKPPEPEPIVLEVAAPGAATSEPGPTEISSTALNTASPRPRVKPPSVKPPVVVSPLLIPRSGGPQDLGSFYKSEDADSGFDAATGKYSKPAEDTPPSAAPATQPAEGPSWLTAPAAPVSQGLALGAPVTASERAEVVAPAAAPEPEPSEDPDWLHELMQSPSESQATSPEAEPAPVAVEIPEDTTPAPDWLTELVDAEPTAPPPAPKPIDEAEFVWDPETESFKSLEAEAQPVLTTDPPEPELTGEMEYVWDPSTESYRAVGQAAEPPVPDPTPEPVVVASPMTFVAAPEPVGELPVAELQLEPAGETPVELTVEPPEADLSALDGIESSTGSGALSPSPAVIPSQPTARELQPRDAAVEEEVDELDNYRFDQESGPPRPPWKSWSLAQRDQVERELGSLVARTQERLQPTYLVEKVKQFLSGRPQGYLLVEGLPGTGKTFLSRALERQAAELSSLPLRVVRFVAQRRLVGDYDIFLQMLNDNASQGRAPRSHRVQPLERPVLHDLNSQYPDPQREGRFTAYMKALVNHNRAPVLLVIDGIDECLLDNPDGISPLDWLPRELPERAFIVVSMNPEGHPKLRMWAQEALEKGAERLSIEIQSPEYRQLLDEILESQPALSGWNQAMKTVLIEKAGYQMATVRYFADAVAGSLYSSVEDLPEAQNFYPELARCLVNLTDERTFREQFLQLLLSLAVSVDPVALDDLDQWGATADTMLLTVALCPGTLFFDDQGLFPSLTLSHDSIRTWLMQAYPQQASAVCRLLTGWVVHLIESAGELRLGGEQGREWARLNFLRLYQWALASKDQSVLEWVVRNKELQKKRIALCQALEQSGRHHQKVWVLDLWVEALRMMVWDYQQKDLRDEYAWACSSRGLSYMNMLRNERALEDVDRAIAMFEELVDQERQVQFRNGLAAAFNRRSEIQKSCHNWDSALKDSGRAVQLYTDLVQDAGRADLRYLLALARHNESLIHRHLKDPKKAREAVEDALKLYTDLVEGDGDERQRSELARCYYTRALVRLDQGELDDAMLDCGRAISMFTTLVEEKKRNDLRNELAAAHNNRGSIYHRGGDYEKAQRDYAKAINLRTLLVEEGRLDLRDDLSLTYTNRGIVQGALGQPKEMLRDYGKAIEIRSQLVLEGRLDQQPDLASNYIYRGAILRSEGQLDEALEDYTRAINLVQVLRKETADDKQSRERDRELALTYSSRGLVCLEMGQYEAALEDCSRSLELLATLSDTAADQAVAHNNRGEAYRKLRQYPKSKEEYQRAARLYTELVESHGQVDLLPELAQAYHNLARVSLAASSAEEALIEAGRALEAFTYLLQQSARADLLPRLAAVYSTRGASHEKLNNHAAALKDLKNAIEIFVALVDDQGLEQLQDELAVALRRRARTQLALRDTQGALESCDDSSRRFQKVLARDRHGPWLDELARTAIVRSAVSTAVQQFQAAEEELRQAIDHFSQLVGKGRIEFFGDLYAAFVQKACNAQKSGNNVRFLEDLGRLIELCSEMMSGPEHPDLRGEIAEAHTRRASALAEQQKYDVAYTDYEAALGLYRQMVVDEGQFHLGKELAETYAARAAMFRAAGHPQPAIEDFSNAAEIYTVLINQGRSDLRARLAAVASARGACQAVLGHNAQAAEDLSVAITLQLALAGENSDPDLYADLGQSLAARARLYNLAGRGHEAFEDYDRAVALFTSLVDNHGRSDLSGALADCLLAHTTMAGGADDPVAVSNLVRAVQLVAAQVKDGRPVPEHFAVEALQTAVSLLENNPESAPEQLVDSVLKLTEGVVSAQRVSANQDWVRITELLLAGSASVANDRRSNRQAYFLTLACLSCNREIQVFGPNSLPRLVYCLAQLGQCLDRGKPPDAVGMIGTCFTLMTEQVPRYSGSPDFYADLRSTVTIWRSLPPSIPAVANVSRYTLSALLKVT